MPGAERAKYLFRIARVVAERARELAVLETLDNGKPIRESRDVDVPTASAHLFHHAGWADKLEYAGLGPDPRPLGVVGAVIPWNFPLLMAAWKIAPALACGNTIVLKPAETTPLTALVLAEIAADAGLPAGRAQRAAGRRGRRCRAGRATTGWTRSRSPDPPTSARRSSAGSPAPGAGSRWSWAARRPTSSTTTRRSTRRSTAWSTGSSSTRATSAAPAPGCSCRSRSREEFDGAAAARIETLRVGDPLDKNTDVGRDQLPSPSWTGSSTSRPPATPRARSAGPARARCPSAGCSSRPPCSPVSSRRCGWRGRRSSGRCCPC